MNVLQLARVLTGAGNVLNGCSATLYTDDGYCTVLCQTSRSSVQQLVPSIPHVLTLLFFCSLNTHHCDNLLWSCYRTLNPLQGRGVNWLHFVIQV